MGAPAVALPAAVVNAAIGKKAIDSTRAPDLKGQSPYSPAYQAGVASLNAEDAQNSAPNEPPTPEKGDKAASEERRPGGRAATILTGGRGLTDVPYRGARRVLLGR